MADFKLGDLGYTLERLQILPVDKIFPHEATKDMEIYSIREAMNRRDGVLKKKMSPLPIMVAQRDDESYVILDGHHRCGALRSHGCSYVLVYIVEKESTDLKGWDEVVCAVGGDFDLKTIFDQTIDC